MLDYLQRSQQVKPEIQMKAEQYINLGYQRLLTFEAPGGGFSLFAGGSPQTFLAAYGLMELSDMAAVFPVDERLIARTREWLSRQQRADGSWESSGLMEGWSVTPRDRLAFTAYAAWALLSSGSPNQATRRALDYLEAQANAAQDPYARALCAHAFLAQDQRHPQARKLLETLYEQRRDDNDLTYWSQEKPTGTNAWGTAANLETTALVALAFIRAGTYGDTITRALDYLIQNKDERGAWHSTQATILALKALIAATGGITEKSNAGVQIVLNEEVVETLHLEGEDSEILHIVDLQEQTRKGSNTVQIRLQGEGQPLYQIVGRYYLPWTEVPPERAEKMEVEVHYGRTTLQQNDTVQARVTLTYRDPTPTYMVILDVGIPPGFRVHREDLEELKRQGTIENFEVTGRQIIFYLGEVSSAQRISLGYRLTAKFPIRAKTSYSTAYEYYSPESRAVAEPTEMVVEPK